jgi:hypothetical protein
MNELSGGAGRYGSHFRRNRFLGVAGAAVEAEVSVGRQAEAFLILRAPEVAGGRVLLADGVHLEELGAFFHRGTGIEIGFKQLTFLSAPVRLNFSLF